MKLAYFAEDGNYGMENGNFALVDVSQWEDEDWAIIESASDWDRPQVAMKIADRYELVNRMKKGNDNA